MTAAFGARPSAAVRALGGLLPPGFRERQRDEWAADLAELTGAERLRYLLGAALTLPQLRRAARRHATSGDVPLAVPNALVESAAKVLLYGLFWPVLSWYLWVPTRYFGSGHTFLNDPDGVWPLSHTPPWLTPLWFTLQVSATAMLFGPALLVAVGVIGGLLTAPAKGRPVVAAVVVGIALFAVVTSGGAWWQDVVVLLLLAGIYFLIKALRPKDPKEGTGSAVGLRLVVIGVLWGALTMSFADSTGVVSTILGYASVLGVGGIGLLATVLSRRSHGLSGPARAGLLILGAATLLIFASLLIPGLSSMNNWLWD